MNTTCTHVYHFSQICRTLQFHSRLFSAFFELRGRKLPALPESECIITYSFNLYTGNSHTHLTFSLCIPFL
jgi:hypothetical protein